jgi:drug/metabolite transporter (DMT)-like permease
MRTPDAPDDAPSPGAAGVAPLRSAAGPWLAFGVSCAIWGSTFLFIRIGNDTTPPVWGAGIRLAIAAVILALLAFVRRVPWPRGRELEAALWFGAIDFGVSLPLLYWGEQRVASGIAAVIYATIPLSTSLFARVFGLERLRPRIVLASLAALAGVAIMFSSDLEGRYEPARLLAVAGGSLTASLAGVMLKRAPHGHPLATNAWAQGVGALMCVVASRMLGESQALPRGDAWIAIGYLALFGSVIAFATFAWLLQHWPVTRTSFIALVIPVLALALGAIVRHERPSVAALAGSVVILGAVLAGVAGERRARA